MIHTIVSFGVALCAIGFAIFACLVEPGATSCTLLVITLATPLLILTRLAKLHRKKIALGFSVILLALAAFSVSQGAFASALAASISLVAWAQLFDWSLRRNPESGPNLEST